ncbi:hypothetical protein J27TS8_27460 [Robertmurraya siralis]|uniref:Uncharacterized protein n=2 Tax=Robertmurraya siralis TaxID=77777 RepID=A0A919WJ57_9BACI|nr:hypothetical protein J27TS8_27460 [Robertmurraya siralis]
MPDFTSFLSGTNLMTFWENVKWFMFLVAPIILIFFATDIIAFVVKVIRGSVTETANKDHKKDDDDDIYYY